MLRSILALSLILSAIAPASALAAGDLEVGIADDAAVLKEPNSVRAARTVAEWKAAGIDSVRILAEWHAAAPDAKATRGPAGFDLGNPDDPRYNWAPVDRAIRFVRDAGLRVNLVVTGPGPLWASSAPARRDMRYKPRADLFGRYARAVALRYGKDVDRYIVWNEPNIPLWLKPQFDCVKRACTPVSPHLYRALVRGAYPAIRTADPGSSVLFGALAPRGQRPVSRNVTMRPLTFLRALGCVDDRLKRLRKGACRRFKPLTADGFAYHPHGILRAPDEPNPNVDEASLGDLPRLKALLDTVQRRGGWRSRTRKRFDLWLTEYGYQTRPPDPIAGVTQSQQARYLQHAAYIAWRDPRVRNLTQYEWRDEPLGRGKDPVSTFTGWQSGLRFASDKPKLAVRSFPQPFWGDLKPGSRRALLWGQVRPGTGPIRVTVQRRRAGRGWTTVKVLSTDARGFWTLRQTVTGTVSYRFSWQPTDSYGNPLAKPSTSDVVRLRPRRRR